LYRVDTNGKLNFDSVAAVFSDCPCTNTSRPQLATFPLNDTAVNWKFDCESLASRMYTAPPNPLDLSTSQWASDDD
jgi:hypothetical protein